MTDSSSNSHGLSEHEVEHIQGHVRFYLFIFGSLMGLTLATVGVAKFIDFDGMIGWEGHGLNITVGLIIATIKASLVALFFMHLSEEKKSIYRFLLFTALFAAALFFLCWWSFADVPAIPTNWNN